jgi:Heavy-metal resistance
MMRKGLVIFAFGLLVAVAAFCGMYYKGLQKEREMTRMETPELYWLKAEFHLSEAEFERVSELHRKYLPGCTEMCRRIDEQDTVLQQILATNSTVTPEVEKALEAAAALRTDCHKRMLNHFYQVASTMPPEQGRRYLAWVQQRTLLPAGQMRSHH